MIPGLPLSLLSIIQPHLLQCYFMYPYISLTVIYILRVSKTLLVLIACTLLRWEDCCEQFCRFGFVNYATSFCVCLQANCGKPWSVLTEIKR